jgi:hypothetical protein
VKESRESNKETGSDDMDDTVLPRGLIWEA